MQRFAQWMVLLAASALLVPASPVVAKSPKQGEKSASGKVPKEKVTATKDNGTPTKDKDAPAPDKPAANPPPQQSAGEAPPPPDAGHAAGSAPAAAAQTAQGVADGIERFYAQHPGFRAAFTQVVTKKGLRAGLRREGKAWLRRGDAAKGDQGRMRWDYPSDEIFYFCDGQTLWSYERRERLAIRVPVRHSQVYQATQYLVGQGNLGRDFHLELLPSTLPDTIALKLVPKSGAQLVKSLTLVVDKTTFAVKASKLVDPLGDTTELVWRDVHYEAADDKTFAWSPPPGVTVKDLATPSK